MAVVDAAMSATVAEIGPRQGLGRASAPPTDTESAAVIERLTPDGEGPRFSSTVLVDTNRLKVIRVTASEGAARTVYFVGIERRDGAPVTDILRVATTMRTYSGCNTWEQPASAVAVTVTAVPFSALLDVEPANTFDDAEARPRSDEPCRESARVTWADGAGFHIDSRRIACRAPQRLRRPVISDDGTINAELLASPSAVR
jgi:hypothetical protein